MKFYIVGIYLRGKGDVASMVHGDALVYAPDKYEALTKVRQTGWIPNPGDIYILGGEGQKRYMEYLENGEIELAKEKAREEGVAILWSTSG